MSLPVFSQFTPKKTYKEQTTSLAAVKMRYMNKALLKIWRVLKQHP